MVVAVLVDDQCRAVRIEDLSAPGLAGEAGQRRVQFSLDAAVGMDEDIGQVARVRAFGVQQAMLFSVRIQVTFGGDKALVRVRAGADAVDVNALRTGLEALGRNMDEHARRAFDEGGSADALSLAVDEGGRGRLCCLVRG